ncbi:MAG: hypothetical protein WCH04_16870 [Gammaproteobacteria bacterium]
MLEKKTFALAGPDRSLPNLAIVVLLAGGVAFGATDAAAGGQGKTDKVCAQTAKLANKACGKDVQDNYLIARAKCQNLINADEKDTCLADAKSVREDEKSECGDVRDARLELCDALTIGGGPYDPVIDPGNFVPADQIVGNTYFPLIKGRTMIYNNTAGETITVTVTGDTTTIMGVPVVEVTDVVEVGGKTTEDTVDWFAQDTDGNVWYFGESTMAADVDDKLVSVDGSWEAGVDGAKPGIVMPVDVPTVGDVYRQEWLLGDAEDAAEILSTTASESAPASGPAVASCSGDCVKTHDYSPIEPDASESKFYAPGVGVIVVLDDNDPAFREELVQIIDTP